MVKVVTLAAPQLGPPRLLRAQLVAPCSLALPGWAPASGTPAAASAARASPASKVADSAAFDRSGDAGGGGADAGAAAGGEGAQRHLMYCTGEMRLHIDEAMYR